MRKKSAKKKPRAKSNYFKKINSSPGVRAAKKRVAKAEKKLNEEKRKKARAVRKAEIAYRKKHKA